VLLEATFAPVPLDCDPVEVSRLEVAVKVYATQPVIVAGLLPDLCIEIDEAVEAELYATRAKVVCAPVSRVSAPATLTVVSVVNRVCVLCR
jgi:hypothetical protein